MNKVQQLCSVMEFSNTATLSTEHDAISRANEEEETLEGALKAESEDEDWEWLRILLKKT